MPISIPSPQARKQARIEIIPLIDIIFFLLATFVMVSLSMVKNRAVPVNLPGASTAQPQEQKDAATLTLGPAGELWLNKVPVDEGTLAKQLAEMVANTAEPRILIAGDAKAEFGRAVAMLDLVRKAGITRVAIQTKGTAAPAPATPPVP